MGTETSVDQEKVWEAARFYSIAMGEVPNSFCTTIRTLVQDHAKDPSNYTAGSRFSISRLLRSKSLSVPLRHATALWYPGAAAASPTSTSEDFLTLYKPLDLAAVLGVLYTYRKAKRRCPAEQWAPLSKQLWKAVDTGALVGVAIPKIGLAYGLFAGAFTYLSIAPFMLQNAAGYKNYRKKMGKKRYSMSTELEMLGCTHAHTCSFLLPALGYGVGLSQSVTEGLLAEIGTAPEANEDRYRIHIARIWTETLIDTGAIPDITHKGGFYPLKADLDRMLSAIAGLSEEDSWLEKGKSDEPEAAQPEVSDAETAELQRELEGE